MSSLGIFNKETKTYQKVAGTAEAAVLDAEMSDSSENPVQNKVIKKYVDDKQVKHGDGLVVTEDGTLKVSLDGTTLTMDQVNNVIKLADTLKDAINGAFPAANVVNNLTTTEEGFALDARQANPNVDGTLAKQISKLNTDIRKKTMFDIVSSEPITLEANIEKEALLNIIPNIIYLNVIYNGEHYTLGVLANTDGVFSIPEINIQYTLNVQAKIIKLTSNVACTIINIFGFI